MRKTGLPGPDPDTAALEKRLSDALGLTVRVAHRADGAGRAGRSATAMSSSSMTSRVGWRAGRVVRGKASHPRGRGFGS